ncbi:MAG: EAL domain-containing protein [Acetobacteraceae bacterium]|nr:EAL domain-containing protein [Acetobacteraceae bacterium]
MYQAAPIDSPDKTLGRRAYLVGVGLFILLLVLAAGFVAVLLRAGAMSEARYGVDQLSIALAEQAGRSLQAVDLALQDTANRVDGVTARAGGDLGEALASPEVNELLRERLGQVPQLDAISVVDAKGRIVNLSRTYPAPQVDLADRDYFQALQTGTKWEPFIGVPIRSRVNGRWTVVMARKLNAGGEFRGLVLGIIALDAIESSYRPVITKPGSSVTLLREDGVILARFPHDESLIGQRYEPTTAAGRVVATHPVLPYRLQVEVAVSEGAALAGWRRQTLAIACFTLLACAGLVLMLRTVARQLRTENEASRSLAARNAELEDARHRLEAQARELAETASALRQGEQLLAERSRTLHTTLENIDQGIMMVDASSTVVAYNQRVVQMLGLPDALLARRPPFREVLQFQWETGEFARTGQTLREFVRSGGMLDRPQVYERERPNGRTIEVRSLPLPGGGIVRTYTDITERKEAEAHIRRIAIKDELTGLANQLSLRDRLDELGREVQPGEGVALLYLDLDRFRLINDARGHEVGDRLLIEVGRRLQAATGPEDLVARIGGDEFAVAHRFTSGQQNGAALAELLLATVAEPFMIGGLRLSITASIGVAVAEPGDSADTLRRNADIAMYRAKDAGGNKAQHYEPAMAAAQHEQFQIEQALREALGKQAFRLAYQPVLSLESDSLVGYEALLRWMDPSRGDVPPQRFIGVAEATGLIVPLGRWVLERACFEAASWDNECSVAVNLSPVQFQTGDLLEVVEDCLARSGLRPQRLELEVTEGVLLEDSGAVLQTMLALRAAGVVITLDDFGTGHAGLSYLRRFPFDKMKIDRSFVRNLGKDPQSDAIVEAILVLGRRLGLLVVAEGVEHEVQLERLRELGCPLVQGYLTGRPMSAEIARAL